MKESVNEIRSLAERGIGKCREGKLEEGYKLLRLVGREDAPVELPGRYYSYLGLCLAGFEGKYNEGVRLCQKGVELEFFQVENYVNLAQTYMMLGSRKPALKAIKDGLKVDRRHPVLLRLRRELGVRKRPVVPFLERDHGVNQVLGRLRHSMRGVPQNGRRATAE